MNSRLLTLYNTENTLSDLSFETFLERERKAILGMLLNPVQIFPPELISH